jgi:argonaute-like protein implicated in RNA metabolism and viral defense
VEAVDAAAVGASHEVPNTTVALSRPLQKDLEDRLAAGKAMVSVEPDENDVGTTQYVNEGKRQDLLSRTPITLVATQTASNTWTFSGTATVGNIVGVQLGSLGASYVILESDTPATIVAGLAASAITAGISATGVGTVFAVTGGGLAARA